MSTSETSTNTATAVDNGSTSTLTSEIDVTPAVQPKKLTTTIKNNHQLHIYEVSNPSNNCTITFHRTLRIPDDGKVYPLPPSLGHFPLCNVDDYLDKVPEDWKKTGGIFFPMHQREAMWMQFHAGQYIRPKALKIAVGKVSAISGKPWSNQLEENDYVIIPGQPWLDGINAGGQGNIKQFVAMPLGSGYSVEAQVTGEEKFGGIQLMVFDSKESERVKRYPVELPTGRTNFRRNRSCRGRGGGRGGGAPRKRCRSDSASATGEQRTESRDMEAREMSLSAGGTMKQQITKDTHGIDFWDQTCFARVYVRIVNSQMFEQITGKKAPPTPITAQTYSSHGYPWFDIYNESPENSIDQTNVLKQVKSVKEKDIETYACPQQDETSIQLSASQVKKLFK